MNAADKPMPALMPHDTAAVLGANATHCDSRSLLLDRFADPAAKEDERKAVFTRAMAKSADGRKAVLWSSFLAQAVPSAPVLYAQLQSRLLVNMAGGVMENAGLCLDRFGLPYIPGSAVKGCARRAALAALHEWCKTGQKPGATPEDKDNVLADACALFAAPADMLAAIARIFGWCEQDWSLARKDGTFISDFAWACGEHRETIWKIAAEELANALAWPIPAEHARTPWKALPNFAGSVSFLAAYPADIPAGTEINGTKVVCSEKVVCYLV